MTGAPTFFESQKAFRRWLEKNHGKATELWVGFYKKASGRGGLQYKEAVDESLCFGWIDGVRKSIDDVSYVQRFSPRKKSSIWSAINIKRVAELKKLGLMHASGLKAFEERDPKKAGLYSFENRPQELSPELERTFRANKKAWAYWETCPPGYKRTITFWVMSAKQEATREKRLARLIEESQNGKRVL